MRVRKVRSKNSKLMIDARGVPSHVCLNCRSSTFKILVKFDNYEPSWWALNGHCANCDAHVTVPCPADDPAQREFDYEV
jgi:hypothetical protein